MIQKSYEESKYGKLYLISTPVGNMEDITIRAIKQLRSVDLILSEDTRVTRILLNKYGIKNTLVACHKFNESKIKDNIMLKLKSGKNIGLVTDRGTPLISDPGSVIVTSAIENNINVISIPGASAVLPALCSSGIDTSRFIFYGFLDTKEGKIKKELEYLDKLGLTFVIYSSPHKLIKTLENMKNVIGNRKISISREISKIYEEVFRGDIEEAIKYYENPLGEIVIVVEGKEETKIVNDEMLLKEIEKLVKDGKSNKEAVKEVALKFHISKNLLYNMHEKEKK